MGNRVRDNALIANRKAERKKQKIRERNIIIIVAAVCLIAVIAVVYIAKMPHYAKIEADGDRYVDRSTGIYYLVAPSNYEPVSYTQKPYGKLSGNYVYPLTGKSTSEWLAEYILISEEYDYYACTAVYYREDLSLPALEDFYPNRIQVCRDSSRAVVRMADIQDTGDVESIVHRLLNAEEAEYPESSEAVYTLRISSPRYSWIYYNISYIVSESGRYYYDRGTGRCVEANDIVARYLEGQSSETEEPKESVSGTGTNAPEESSGTGNGTQS